MRQVFLGSRQTWLKIKWRRTVLRAEAVLAQKFWGPLYHRVHFTRSPKTKKYERHIGLHLLNLGTSESGERVPSPVPT